MCHRYWTTPRSTFVRSTYPTGRSYYTPRKVNYVYYGSTENPVWSKDAPYSHTQSTVEQYTHNTASNFVTGADKAQSSFGHSYNDDNNDNNNVNNNINDNGGATTKKSNNNYHNYLNRKNSLNANPQSKSSISPNDVNYSRNNSFKHNSPTSTTLSNGNRYHSQANDYGKTFFSDPKSNLVSSYFSLLLSVSILRA